MFTGLVEEIGEIAELRSNNDGLVLRIHCDNLRPFVLGESIAVHGVCLTVASLGAQSFDVYVSGETLERTNLCDLTQGSPIHLERAIALGGRLGGHFVSGHVDGVGSLCSSARVGDCIRAVFEVPKPLALFLVPKGSITVNGVSLTINGTCGPEFDVMLVPHTLDKTTFGTLALQSHVNIEVDILAKYVASMMGRTGVNGI